MQNVMQIATNAGHIAQNEAINATLNLRSLDLKTCIYTLPGVFYII